MEESQELTSEQDQNGEPTAKEETPQQEAAPAPSPEAQRIAELEAQLAQAKREAAENWNKYLRERADMENFRKRQERMAVDRVQREKRELFQKILGVMDNVERALKYQDTMDSQGLQQALRMLMWQMNEVMRGEGLTPVATVGETFDPYVHEAIEAVEDTDKPEGTVVEEVLKGYKLGDETLRPARVKVSAGNKQAQ
ncbi:MAG TPA: nucleotide exchange factor GrpE [Ktedonobacteraceae bacterium]|nr:nucleotide exchange factor GrpE [Ktedonobacteraceae bacterium]